MRTMIALLLVGLLGIITKASSGLATPFDSPYRPEKSTNATTNIQAFNGRPISEIERWSNTTTRIQERLNNGWYWESATFPDGGDLCKIEFLVRPNGIVYRAAIREKRKLFPDTNYCAGIKMLNYRYLERKLQEDVQRVLNDELRSKHRQ